MGLFNVFGSEKKTSTTNQSTTNTYSDDSMNVSEGVALAAGAHYTVNTADPEVAKAAVGSIASTAESALAANLGATEMALGTGLEAFSRAAELAGDTLKSQRDASSDQLVASLENVNYARQLANTGLTASLDARRSDTERIIESVGKPIAWGAVAVGIAVLGGIYLIRRKAA